MDLKIQFGEIIDKLRRQKPVIHHITNYVTAESCADIALAAGASPVMADDPEEVEEITSNADALVLNLGTFSFNKMIAMEKAAVLAKEAGIPVFAYGNFISAIIYFIILAFVVFLLVKAVAKVRGFVPKKEEEPKEPTTKKCPFCCTEINIKATRCPHCTSEIPEEEEKEEEEKSE